MFGIFKSKNRTSRSPRGHRKKQSSKSSVKGYTIRGRLGRVTYIGVTNNPKRRAEEHERSGKKGTLKVETKGMSRRQAENWEGKRLSGYRRKHRGNNPKYNKTRNG